MIRISKIAKSPPGAVPTVKTFSAKSGGFLLSEEATTILDHIVAPERSAWRPTMRRAGVSEADCEAIAGAFLYEGFFYEEALSKVPSPKFSVLL